MQIAGQLSAAIIAGDDEEISDCINESFYISGCTIAELPQRYYETLILGCS